METLPGPQLVDREGAALHASTAEETNLKHKKKWRKLKTHFAIYYTFRDWFRDLVSCGPWNYPHVKKTLDPHPKLLFAALSA